MVVAAATVFCSLGGCWSVEEVVRAALDEVVVVTVADEELLLLSGAPPIVVSALNSSFRLHKRQENVYMLVGLERTNK